MTTTNRIPDSVRNALEAGAAFVDQPFQPGERKLAVATTAMELIKRETGAFEFSYLGGSAGDQVRIKISQQTFHGKF